MKVAMKNPAASKVTPERLLVSHGALSNAWTAAASSENLSARMTDDDHEMRRDEKIK